MSGPPLGPTPTLDEISHDGTKKDTLVTLHYGKGKGVNLVICLMRQ